MTTGTHYTPNLGVMLTRLFRKLLPHPRNSNPSPTFPVDKVDDNEL